MRFWCFVFIAYTVYLFPVNVLGETESLICPIPEQYVSYGPFDSQGIPMRDFGGTLGVVYHPLVVAEFASYYDGLFKETNDKKYLDALINMAKWLIRTQRSDGYWEYEWDNSYMGVLIKAPWVSAVTQGFGAQSLLKAYSVTGEKKYLNAAHKALLALGNSVRAGGVGFPVEGGGVFFEEVPSSSPTHILNGHLTALRGLQKFLSVSESIDVRQLFDKGILALKFTLPFFDTGYWSKYDLILCSKPESQSVYFLLPENIGTVNAEFEIDGSKSPLTLEKVEGENFTTLDKSSIVSPDYSLYGAPLVFSLGLRSLNVSAISVVLKLERIKPLNAFISWKENKKILLPIAGNNGNYVISPQSLGHNTGSSYHTMVVQQLKQLFVYTKSEIFQEYAEKFETYTQKNGAKVLK